MSLKNLSDKLQIDEKDGLIKLAIDDVSTNWICGDDPFIDRLADDKINRFFKSSHLACEINIKNILDEGIRLLNLKSYPKAIKCFDEVIYYDEKYGEALISKSRALFGQGHFVKSLRFYKRAVGAGYPKDLEYYKLLLKKSGEERDGFPKIKQNIYAGDEAAAKGEFELALEFYEKALMEPSKFKNKILYKLFNKKAFILTKLKRFDESLTSFDESLKAHENDIAYFGRGLCKHCLGIDCVCDLKLAVYIDKRYILKKALIFNGLGLYGDALDAFNEFLDKHFVIDSAFMSAIEGKAAALENLNMDSSFERHILCEVTS